MKHNAHPHVLRGQVSRTMSQLRLHTFIHDMNRDIVSSELSKQNEGREEIRLHRLGDNISSGSAHCIQFGRVSVLLSVDTLGKSKTLERFVKGR